MTDAVSTPLLPTAASIRALLTLALPVVIVQVGMMLMGVVDTIMVGRLSASALAAVALGNLYFFALTIFGMGVLTALDPVIAQAVGAGDEAAVSRGIQRGLIIALALTVPTSLLLWPGEALLGALGQPREVVPLAATYARAVIAGILPHFAFIVLRQSLQAMGRMRPIVLTIVLANMANLVLNYALIYGRLGAPALGVEGAGWATSISRWIMALALLAAAWRELRHHLHPLRPETLQLQPLARMARLGGPIGVQWQLEYGVFAVVALLMGWLGTVAMAGHQIAINLASLTFMVPMGVSAAAAVLVGQAVGRADPAGARQAARAALLCGVGFMCVSAVVLLAIPRLLAGLYTTDAGVLAVAGLLIPIAGVFQVFDGTQVVASGILRGVGDTRAPMIVNVLGFWMIGMPVSVWLGFRTSLGAAGLWWGLVVGLAAVAAFLMLRVRSRMRREMVRVMIDAAA